MTKSTRSREWRPFVIDKDVMEIAERFRKGRESAQVWPVKFQDHDHYLVPFAESWLPTRLQPKGFLVLDSKRRFVKDAEVCSKIVKTFRVWEHIYFKPLRKHELGYESLSRYRERIATKLCDDCRNRLAQNQYENTDDPALRKLNQKIRKLDESVVRGYDLFLRQWRLIGEVMRTEKEIWKAPSFEKVQAYVMRIIPEVKRSNDAMMAYLKERTDLMFEMKKALQDYESTLRIPVMRRPFVIFLSFLAALYSPIYGLVVLLLDEVAKMCYAELTGYKVLLSGLERLRKMQPKMDEIAQAFEGAVAPELIRGPT